MDKTEIITVLYELHRISGFRISLHGADFEEIAAYPERQTAFCERVRSFAGGEAGCKECVRRACLLALEKKSTHIYKCRYGLTGAVSPLYNVGTPAGFLMMGEAAESDADAEAAVRILSEIGGGGDDFTLADSLPRISREMIESYAKIMTICAQYLAMSSSVPGTRTTVPDEAKKYIAKNLEKKFAINDICNHLRCSKSTLLTSFKRECGITVNAYITQQRLSRAERLLHEEQKAISEVAILCGFSDQSYFSKVFSAKYGIPPSEYRHKIRSTEY